MLFRSAELKGIFGFTTNSTTVFGADYRCEVLRRPDSDLDKSVYTASGAEIYQAGKEEPLRYNKPDLLNPWFIVKRN